MPRNSGSDRVSPFASWFVYLLLLALRLACATLPGYIHPDEFFQGGQELFFGCTATTTAATAPTTAAASFNRNPESLEMVVPQKNKKEKADEGEQEEDGGRLRRETCVVDDYDDDDDDDVCVPKQTTSQTTRSDIPWEFEPRNAVRSIVPPKFMTLMPLWIYIRMKHRLYRVVVVVFRGKNRFGNGGDGNSLENSLLLLSGREIWIVPRLFLALLSVLTVDASVWMLTPSSPSSSSEKKWTKRGGDDVAGDASRARSERDESDEYSGTNTGGERGDEIPDNGSGAGVPRDGTPYLGSIVARPVPTRVLILASAWPSLTFLNRPFGNALETMCLACLLSVIVMDWKNEATVVRKGKKRGEMNANHESDSVTMSSSSLSSENNSSRGVVLDALVGMTCSVGIFVRFTFAFYAFPAIAMFLHTRASRAFERTPADRGGGTKRKGAIDPSSYSARVRRCLASILVVTLAFLITSLGFILVDAEFYNNRNSDNAVSDPIGEGDSIGSFTSSASRILSCVTPLNALLYNSKLKNLSEHGLHPHYLHAVVNMPMLFGPLAVWVYVGIGRTLADACRSRMKNNDKGREILARGTEGLADNEELLLVGTESSERVPLCVEKLIATTCFWVILSGLGVLSLAPHQEPRFLLPLLVPFVVMCDRDFGSAGEWAAARVRWCVLILIWAVFNAALLIFFGGLHQAGVVPALLANYMVHLPENEIQHTPPNFTNHVQPDAVIFYHTYMPPTFLTRNLKTDGADSALFGFSSPLGISNDGIDASLSEAIPTIPFATGSETIDAVLRRFSKSCPKWPIVDLKGSDLGTLKDTLREHLACNADTGERPKNVEIYGVDRDKAFVYVVAPSATFRNHVDARRQMHARAALSSDCPLGEEYHCSNTRFYRPHVTTEDFPPWEGSLSGFWMRMELVVYRVSCTQ